MVCIMLLLHPIIIPFEAKEANIVEMVNLLTLAIISSFNVALSSRLSGGADPNNDTLDHLVIALLIIPFITAVIAFIYNKRCGHKLPTSTSSIDDNNDVSSSSLLSSVGISHVLVSARSENTDTKRH
jgi:hypothetical protein